MQIDVENYIDNLWKQTGEDSFINLETGEVHNSLQRQGYIQQILDNEQLDNFHSCNYLYEKYQVPNNRIIRSKKSKKPETTCIPWKNSKSDLFIKIYRTEGYDLIMNKILDAYEKAFMFTIQYHLEFKTNCIIIDGDYPTLDYLADLTGLSVRKIKDVVKTLENKNIIKRYKDGINKKIFVNPNYMCAGSIIEGEIPSFFIDQIEDKTKELFKI